MQRSSLPRAALLVGVLCAVLCLARVATASDAAATAGATETTGAVRTAEPKKAAHETLLEDDFTALDLFEGIRRLRPRIRLLQEGVIDQDFGGSQIDLFESGLEASVVAPLSRVAVIRLAGSVSGAYYDFHGDETFIDTNRSGDPFDSLMSTQFQLEGRYQITDSWTIVGGSQFSSRWEEGSAYARGIQQGGFVGVGHLFGDRFSAVVGLGVRSRMGRGGVSLSPVVQLGWRITDNVEIETRGLGVNIAARVSRDLTLYLISGFPSESYRLGDRGDDVDRGVLIERNVPVRIGARLRISKRWRLRAFAGAVFYQRYTVEDSDGNFHDSASTSNPAFSGTLGLEYRF